MLCLNGVLSRIIGHILVIRSEGHLDNGFLANSNKSSLQIKVSLLVWIGENILPTKFLNGVSVAG